MKTSKLVIFASKDILKGYSQTLGKNRYVICRVGETYPDEENLGRTGKIWYRPRDSRDKSLTYKNEDLVSEIISVQRLIFIQRAILRMWNLQL